MTKDEIRRTGVTNLTNSELVMLDMLATSVGTRASFRTGIFGSLFGYPCHGLQDVELDVTLNRFQSNGWTTETAHPTDWSDKGQSITMTPAGGALWESERLPDWSRFIQDAEKLRTGCDSEPYRFRTMTCGHSNIIVREFFDIGCKCLLFNNSIGRVRTGVVQRALISWRPLQPVNFLSAWVMSSSGTVDWKKMDRLRTWWRFPNEIGKLWELPLATSSDRAFRDLG